MGNLRVFRIKPMVTATWKKGWTYQFKISVSASEVPKGIAKIEFDPNIFELVGNSAKEVNIPGGSYNKNVTWNIKPIAAVEDTTIAAIVSSAERPQTASARIKVIE